MGWWCRLRTLGSVRMTRKAQARGGRYCGIGMARPKIADNLGTLWRSAVCLDAAFIFTIGARYHKQASDTVKSWRHIPYFSYRTVEEFAEHIPYDCIPVAVELTPDAKPLETYSHPRNALYLLGPEDGSLTREELAVCREVVKIDSLYCLNVASAGTVVLYDRQQKGWRNGPVAQSVSASPCHGEGRGFESRQDRDGSVAQLAEHPSETRERVGSTPTRTTFEGDR